MGTGAPPHPTALAPASTVVPPPHTFGAPHHQAHRAVPPPRSVSLETVGGVSAVVESSTSSPEKEAEPGVPAVIPAREGEANEDTSTAASSSTPAASPTTVKTNIDPSEDRMAIMAAVAMTQLFGGGGAGDESSRASVVSMEKQNVTTSIKRKLEDREVVEEKKVDDVAEVAAPPIPTTAAIVEEQRQPPQKMTKVAEEPSQHHLYPPSGSQRQLHDVESRNPSPVSMMPGGSPTHHDYGGRPQYQSPYDHDYPSYHRRSPTTAMHPPQHHYQDHHYHHPADHHVYHRHHEYHHPHYQGHYHVPPPPPPRTFPYYGGSPRSVSGGPPPPQGGGSGVPASSSSTTTSNHHGSSSSSTTLYEDVTKTSGLPKSLSFRKICSKCGKTRGEHGELGFGNKCVYQDCGKCGAGIHVHEKHDQPMGILCRLTVEQGAIPGHAAAYDRKIRDLAARAELQKSINDDKRERVNMLIAQQTYV